MSLFGNSTATKPVSSSLFGGAANKPAGQTTTNAAQKKKISPEEHLQIYREKRKQIIEERTLKVRALHNSKEFYNFCRQLANKPNSIEVFKEVLTKPEMVDRYSKVLLYFTKYESQDLNQILTSKQVKGVLNKFKITPQIEMCVKHLAEAMDLDVFITFKLFEEVCFENINYLIYIKENLDEGLLSKLTKECWMRYEFERGTTLKSLIYVMGLAERPDELGSLFSNFLQGLIEKGLVNNLWKSYKNLSDGKMTKAQGNNKYAFYEQIISEQSWIMRIMYKGFVLRRLSCDDILYMEMLNLMVGQQFKGSYKVCLNDIGLQSSGLKGVVTSISSFSFLTLTAALNLESLVYADLESFFDTSTMPMKLLQKQTPQILEAFKSAEENMDDIKNEGGFYINVLQTLIDLTHELIRREMNRDSKRSNISELSKVQLVLPENFNALVECTGTISFITSIASLLHSPMVLGLNPSELEDVRRGVKLVVSMEILQIDENMNPLDKFTFEEVEYTTKLISECISIPHEFQDFWQNDHNPFRQFLRSLIDMFPQCETATSHLLNAACGSLQQCKVEDVLRFLTEMSYFSMVENPVDMKLEVIESQDDSKQYYRFSRDFPQRYGLLIPKNTLAVFSSNEVNEGRITAYLEGGFNYLSIVWKNWRQIVFEGFSKGASIDLRMGRYIELVCKFVELVPHDAVILQQRLFNVQRGGMELEEECEGQSVASLIFTILDTLALLQGSCEWANLNLALMKALNALLFSRFGKQVLMAVQIYQTVRPSYREGQDVHPLIGLVSIFDKAQNELGLEREQLESPLAVVYELTKFMEGTLSMSDHLFDHLPSPKFFHKQRMEDIKIVENELVSFIKIFDESSAGEGSGPGALEYQFQVLLQLSTEGKLIAKTSFLEDAFGLLVRDFLQKQQSQEFDLQKCQEYQLLIHAKLLAVINNLLERFKVGHGQELQGAGNKLHQQALEQISNFLNSIHLDEYLFSFFRVSLNYGVFFGDKQAQEFENPLGVDNALWVNELKLNNLSRVGNHLQKVYIELLEILRTTMALISDRNRHVLKARSSEDLSFLNSIASKLCEADSLHSFCLRAPGGEFQINIFLAIALMAGYNDSMDLQQVEFFNPDYYLHAYSELTEDEYLLFTHNVLAMFVAESHLPSIYSTGRYARLGASNSLSQSVLETLTSFMRLWKSQRTGGRRPQLTQVMQGTATPSEFPQKANEFLFNVIVSFLQRPMSRPSEAAAATEFMLECLKSQRPFFQAMVKHCANLKQRTVKLNELVVIFQKMIKWLKAQPPQVVMSRKSLLRILISLTEMISILIIRDDGFYELVGQLRKFVIEDLEKLLISVLEKRRDPLESIFNFARQTLTLADGQFAMIEGSSTQHNLAQMKMREMAELESRFSHSLGLFARVGRSEFFLSVYEQFTRGFKNEAHCPLMGRLLPETLKSLLGSTIINVESLLFSVEDYHLGSFLATLEELDAPSAQVSMYMASRPSGNPELSFQAPEGGHMEKEYESGGQDPRQANNPLAYLDYNEALGIRYEEISTMRLLKEMNINNRKTNTLLYALNIFNSLNHLKQSRLRLLDELNTNLSLVSSLGFTGTPFATVFSQDNLGNPTRFLAATEQQHSKKPFLERTIIADEDLFSNQLSSQDSIKVLPALKSLLNPYSGVSVSQNVLDLLGLDSSRLSAYSFKEAVDSIKELLSYFRKDFLAIKTGFTDNMRGSSFSLKPFAMIERVCLMSSSYITLLGYFTSNLYHLKESDPDYEQSGLICSVFLTELLDALNSSCDYVEQCMEKAGSNVYNVVVWILKVLSVLSHFQNIIIERDVMRMNQIHRIVRFLEIIVLKKSEHFSIALTSMGILNDMKPNLVSKEYIDRLLIFMAREDIKDNDYMSICQYLLSCFECEYRRTLISESRILKVLCELQRFSTAEFTEAQFYSKENRNPFQMMWCWTLQLANAAFQQMVKIPLKFNFMIGFIARYQQRFCMILSYKDSSDLLQGVNRSKNFTGGEINQSLPFRTSAFLQELELTLSVLSTVLDNSLEFKNKNDQLFEIIFFLLTNRTVHLFSKDNCTPDNFKAVDWLEIAIQKIQLGGAHQSANATKEKTSLAPSHSLRKRTIGKSSNLSGIGGYRSKDYGNGYGRVYRPDLFTFKVDLQYQRILLLLMNCIVEQIEHSDFYRHFYDSYPQELKDNSQSNSGKMTNLSYHHSFWKNFSASLVDIQSYCQMNKSRIVNRREVYTEGIFNLKAFNVSTEVTSNNYALNSIEEEITPHEMEANNMTSLEMSLYVQNIMYQHLDEQDLFKGPTMLEALNRDKAHTASILEDISWSDRGTGTTSKFKMEKMSINSNLDLRTIREEEVQEDKFFLNFMKNYYGQSN